MIPTFTNYIMFWKRLWWGSNIIMYAHHIRPVIIPFFHKTMSFFAKTFILGTYRIFIQFLDFKKHSQENSESVFNTTFYIHPFKK